MAGPRGGTYDGARAAALTQARRIEKAMDDGWQFRFDGAHDQFVASKDVLAAHSLDELLIEVERAQGRGDDGD